MSETLSGDQWIERILGISPMLSQGGPPNDGQKNDGQKQVRLAPVPVVIPPPKGPAIKIGTGRSRSNAVVGPPPQMLKPGQFGGDNGRVLTVGKLPGGGVQYVAPPPPVSEITFSGGGGKGMALAGAIQALQDNDVLKDAKVITGASVGSMTAALVAAGITAEEFTEVANAQSTTDRIVEGTGGSKTGLAKRAIENKWNTGSANPLTGMGLENVVREVIDASLNKRMQEYKDQCEKDGTPVNADVARISQIIALNKDGATFMDLRQLSAVIPAIKEVVITGTYTTELGTTDKDSQKDFKNENKDGQLYVFSADTEPKLPVAIAVHASASFPAAFKPVDIKLASGLTVRFIDGGAMNNTPTGASIGNDRNLDPMPQERGMTFVFEDEGGNTDNLLAGKVTPATGKMARLQDWFVGAGNAGAEYGKDSDLALRPEEIVVVPLTLPPKPGSKKKYEYDMRGGTLDFNVPDDLKLKFQENTAKATKAQIDRENKPKAKEFASDSQMFVSIPLSDLSTLAKGGYPGADEAVTFRTRVAEMIDKLVQGLSKAQKTGKAADALKDKDVTMALSELDTLAGDDVDFQGYVGREMNKGSLDSLIGVMDRSKPTKAMGAVFAVSDAVKVKDWSNNVLKEVVYPKMKNQNKGGSGLQTLVLVESKLRAAKTPTQFNAALRIGIDHFKTKPDARPRRGHKELAANLERRLMRVA